MRALIFLVVLLFTSISASISLGEAGADLTGRVRVGLEGAELARLMPIVVFLEPADEASLPGLSASPLPPITITQQNATFAPRFSIIEAGQTLQMPNADAIYHNVFSYSKGNEFDLGIYPAGESRRVVLRQPGLVRIYCSIHETMNALVLVVPTRHFGEVDGAGRFWIADVPPGRWRLRVWSEVLPPVERELRLEPGEPAAVVIDLLPADA